MQHSKQYLPSNMVAEPGRSADLALLRNRWQQRLASPRDPLMGKGQPSSPPQEWKPALNMGELGWNPKRQGLATLHARRPTCMSPSRPWDGQTLTMLFTLGQALQSAHSCRSQDTALPCP